jgi:hypothetical protein
MILRNRLIASPQGVIRTGLVFLIVASLFRLFVKPGEAMSENVVDGLTGFLYGLAIATLLMGLWLRRIKRS